MLIKYGFTEFLEGSSEKSFITSIAYDWVNKQVYAAVGDGWEYGNLYKISTETGKIEYVLHQEKEEYKNAPTNSKDLYVIKRVAIDPIDPRIVYCGGATVMYNNICSLYRSVDGGKSFQVVTSNTINSIIKEGNQGGFEIDSLEVNPQTGELLVGSDCFGISKLTPPYNINSLFN